MLSFDDGYLSHYTHAKPVLRELGWPGVLYLEIKSIGPGGLTEHQIRSLMNAGWEIDSHTLTHPDLTTLDDAALAARARRLAQRAAQALRRAGRLLRLSGGRYDARVEAATKAAGYTAATTVDEGIARGRDDPFALKRVRVNASDTAVTLLAKLARLRISTRIAASSSERFSQRGGRGADALLVELADDLAALGEHERLHAPVGRVGLALGEARPPRGGRRSRSRSSCRSAARCARSDSFIGSSGCRRLSANACCGASPNSCATASICPRWAKNSSEHQPPRLLLRGTGTTTFAIGQM